jgi:hypothetical protein
MAWRPTHSLPPTRAQLTLALILPLPLYPYPYTPTPIPTPNPNPSPTPNPNPTFSQALTPAEAPWLTKLEYSPWLVANLHLRSIPREGTPRADPNPNPYPSPSPKPDPNPSRDLP